MEADRSVLTNNFQEQITLIKKNAKFFYFQHVIPGIGGLINSFKEPKRILDRVFPSQIGMWFAVAFACVGLLVLFSPNLFWKWQFLLIIVVLMLGPIIYKLLKMLFESMKKMLLVYPGKEYVGQTFTLENAIAEGEGEANLDGNEWVFSGEDMPAGTTVKVIAVKDDVLYVVPADINTNQLPPSEAKS